MRIEIELNEEEELELRAIRIRFGVSPEALLTGFVADLTESRRANGGDEKALADEYLTRAYEDRRSEGALLPLSEAEEDEYQRLTTAAHLALQGEERRGISKTNRVTAL